MIKQDYRLDILDNGDRGYYYKYQLHRSNGPAFYRLDGPAAIHPDGLQYYWVDGKYISKKEFYRNYYQEKK